MMELDTRQRAMLQEMGIRVWLPDAEVMATTTETTLIPASAPAAMPVAESPAAATALHSSQTRQPPAVVRAPAPEPEPAPKAVLPSADLDAPDLQSHDWPSLAAAASTCAACGLCASRRCSTLLPPTEVGNGVNTARCDWMVVGDVPDEAEDLEANPFAGNDGLLLDNILRALGVQRVNRHPEALASGMVLAKSAAERAYVTNVVKCRPGHGQIPQAADLAQCAAYLQREIALVQPRVILALGRFAQQTLLAATPELAGLPLGKLRGVVHQYAGIPVVLSYHPKQLMRTGADNAKAKADAWADWCLAAQAVAQTVPQGPGH